MRQETLISILKHMAGRHSQLTHGMRYSSAGAVKKGLGKLKNDPEAYAKVRQTARKKFAKAKGESPKNVKTNEGRELKSQVWSDNMALAKEVSRHGYEEHKANEYGSDTSTRYYKHNKLAEAIEDEENRVKKIPDWMNVTPSSVQADEIGEELVNKMMKQLGIKGRYKHPTLERSRAKLAEQEKQSKEAEKRVGVLAKDLKDKNLNQLKSEHGVEEGTFTVKMRKGKNGWEDVEVKGLIVGKLGIVTDNRKKFKDLHITHIDTGMSTGIPKFSNQTNAVKAAIAMNHVGNWDFGTSDIDSEAVRRGTAELSPKMKGARHTIMNLSAGTEDVRY